MLKIGIVGIFLSVIIFVAAMVSPQLLSPLGSLFCQPGEHLTSQQYTSSYRPGETDTSDTFACENSDGQQRDVTGSVTGAAVVVYLIFLFGSVGLTIVGGQRTVRARVTSWSSNYTGSSFGNTGTSGGWNTNANQNNQQVIDGLQRGVIRFGGQEVSIADLRSGAYQHTPTADSKRSLADTLRQLEDAHKQGLIDDDEYGHLRQEALDKLV